jgi:N-acetylneuraminate lyase
MYDFLNAATGVIPNLVGMKYSHYDLMDFADCIRFFEPRYNMLYGHEEYMLGALTHGAEGFVGSTFNLTFLMPHYLQLVQSGSSHEKESNNNLEMPLALKMQERSHDFIGVMFRHGGIPVLKAVVKAQGFDCGNLRLPGRSLPADKVQAALHDIETLGFDISK